MQHPNVSISLQLHRDAHGRLVLTLPDGTVHSGVVPVRAFPLAAPQEGLSIVGSDGHELIWLDRFDALPEAARAMVEEELAVREFVPTIVKIITVSSFSTPSTWSVETDRGPTRFTLKGEEDIRRLSQIRLLIADANGIQFLVRDLSTLDKQSRKLLDRFL